MKICLFTSLMPILGSSFQNRKYQSWILRVLVELEMPKPHGCSCLFAADKDTTTTSCHGLTRARMADERPESNNLGWRTG